VVSRPPSEKPSDTLLCVGCGRLPGFQKNEMLVVEIEVDRDSLRIVKVYISPDFEGLRQLLSSELEGMLFSDLPTAGTAAVNRLYLSPFRNAARAALRNAAESYAIAQKRPATTRYES
jgi:hypothetical protein